MMETTEITMDVIHHVLSRMVGLALEGATQLLILV
jgi:hypothetical protein